jgi:hypothetical protein
MHTQEADMQLPDASTRNVGGEEVHQRQIQPGRSLTHRHVEEAQQYDKVLGHGTVPPTHEVSQRQHVRNLALQQTTHHTGAHHIVIGACCQAVARARVAEG